MKNKFLEFFHRVFEDNFTVKTCGRETCKLLIAAARTIDRETDFGSVKTGVMNVDTLIDLYKKVNKSLI